MGRIPASIAVNEAGDPVVQIGMGSLQSGFVATLRGRLRFYYGGQHSAGHFGLACSKDPKLRGNANQEANYAGLK